MCSMFFLEHFVVLTGFVSLLLGIFDCVCKLLM